MFRALFVVVIAIGALVGFMAPDRPEPPRVALAATPAAATRDKPNDTVLKRAGDGHFYVDALVNGQAVHFVVDTGASGVALTSEDARRIGLDFTPDQFTVIGTGASGNVMGKRVKLGSVAIDQKEAFDVPGAIIADGLDISLLGQSYLSHIGSVSISNDEMILR